MDTEQIELESLENEAEGILSAVAVSAEEVSETQLKKLEQISERAAKISFGSGCPELLSEQMQNLIRWTDHLDEAFWVRRFKITLKIRPLASPWQ
jgi:hypothetical protein